MDREKVMKELEILRDICNAKSNMAIGKGKVAWAGYANTADDALALLKELDPVEPELEGGGSSWWHVCGECHGTINEDDRFCKHCGRRIKHEKTE